MENLEQYFNFERRWRLVERGVRFLLAAIVAAGVTGLTGDGPLSGRKNRIGASGTVEYERFLRDGAPARLRLSVPTDANENGKIRVRLGAARGADILIRQYHPEPTRMEALADGVLLTFEVPAGSPASITMMQEPSGFGRVASDVEVIGVGRTQLAQLVYP